MSEFQNIKENGSDALNKMANILSAPEFPVKKRSSVSAVLWVIFALLIGGVLYSVLRNVEVNTAALLAAAVLTGSILIYVGLERLSRSIREDGDNRDYQLTAIRYSLQAISALFKSK